DHVEAGRLAGTVGPEQSHHLAGAHLDADPLHHAAPAERLGEAVRTQQRRAGPVHWVPRAAAGAAGAPAFGFAGAGGGFSLGWTTASTRFWPPSTTLRFSSRWTVPRSPTTTFGPSCRTGFSVSTSVRCCCS